MEEKHPVLKPHIFSQFHEVVCGMSTMLGGWDKPPYYNNMSFYVGDDPLIVKSNRQGFFGRLNIDQDFLAIPQQVHSDDVGIVETPGFYQGTDALITSKKDVFLIISTADCFSAMLFDKNNGVTAAVHSGWRGTQKKILKKTINTLKESFGSKPEELFVFVGPGISADNFEVSPDTAELFPRKFVETRDGRSYVDLKSNILEQLSESSIPERNIEVFPLCTFKQKDYLHSFRRDKEKSGRMFSVIGRK